MVQASQFCEKVMKMQVHTYNTFQRSTAPSRLEEYQKMLSYSVFSHSHYWGKPNSGSTSTKTNTIHGTYARLLSWQNSFLPPRPMLYVGRLHVSNNNMMNHSLKHGKDSRITLMTILIMGYTTPQPLFSI